MPEGQHYLSEPRPKGPVWVVALAVAVVALLAAGGAGLGVVHRHRAANNGLARATVMASIGDAFAHKTALATLHLTVNGGMATGGGTGQIDFTRGAMSMRLSVHASGVSQTASAVYQGGTIYEQLPQVSRVAPGKSWLSMDLSSLIGRGATATAPLGGANPVAMLKLLTQQGAVVSPAGSRTLDGVRVQGYRVDISPAAIQKQVSSANLPDWMRQAMSSLSFGQSTEYVYLDPANQLRRFELAMVFRAQGVAVNVDETVDLSDYGVPVSIQVPPASQVISMQQFLQLAQGANSSA